MDAGITRQDDRMFGDPWGIRTYTALFLSKGKEGFVFSGLIGCHQ